MVFDVALWQRWPSIETTSVLPEHVAVVDAPNAFTAVAGVMRWYRLCRVAHAAAMAQDGSIRYRACQVRLAESWEVR